MKKTERATVRALLNTKSANGTIPLDRFVAVMPILPEAIEYQRKAIRRKRRAR